MLHKFVDLLLFRKYSTVVPQQAFKFNIVYLNSISKSNTEN